MLNDDGQAKGKKLHFYFKIHAYSMFWNAYFRQT